MYSHQSGVTRSVRVMHIRKMHIQSPDKLWVSIDYVLNTFSRKGLLPETNFDVIQYFRVTGIRFVENCLQRRVSRPKSIAKVLSKDLSTVGIGRLLDGMTLGVPGRCKEGIERDSV